MAPSKGRIVLVKLRDADGPVHVNGSDEHPAVVTAVHSETMINARVLHDDSGVPLWVTSVPHEDSAVGYGGHTWRWPPREEG